MFPPLCNLCNIGSEEAFDNLQRPIVVIDRGPSSRLITSSKKYLCSFYDSQTSVCIELAWRKKIVDLFTFCLQRRSSLVERFTNTNQKRRLIINYIIDASLLASTRHALIIIRQAVYLIFCSWFYAGLRSLYIVILNKYNT